ncbi:hypothetical protein O5O45_10885 [Hahella aquimaris]|uniref:hypothetical protein n=1 Tax=Hahella sp. HNIBRBA332 TaxID=3015983 RepID=UPI00273BD49A|nr:hypothetical protein [Hahella sp. HNIBRBA332]WLQ16424.1 hypothetical protein O5O45_10885 [Hahella sp. HNIBRBA332]
MPVQYDCQSCNLTFKVGGYHGITPYEDYDGGVCAVCMGCGVQYSIFYGNEYRGPEYFEEKGVEIVGYAQESKIKLLKHVRQWYELSLHEAKNKLNDMPFIFVDKYGDPDRIASSLLAEGIEARLVMLSRVKNPYFGKPKARDILEKFDSLLYVGMQDADIEVHEAPYSCKSGEQGRLDLESTQCMDCGAEGAIQFHFEDDLKKCPSCKVDALVESGGFVS